MKKILIIACALTTNVTSAASLECAEQRLDYAQGLSQDIGVFMIAKMYKPYHGNDFTNNAKWKSFNVTITMPSPMSEVLAGNYLQVITTRYDSGITSIYGPPMPGPQITAGVNTISASIPCVVGVSRQCTHHENAFNLVISSHPTKYDSAKLNRDVVLPGDLSARVSMTATSSNVFLRDRNHDVSALRLISRSVTTDSITFPNTIDIGTLTGGANNIHGHQIDYTMTTNNVPVTFTASTTSGASITNNGSTIRTGTKYKPPFTFGLNISPDASPGTYTSNVTASWTCP